MSEPFIQLTNVGKTYQTNSGAVEACLDINLDIRQSEFVAIVGPSGCGKTTILKMVAGLAPYTSGSITVGGQRVDRPQTDVGIVFQEAIMLDWRDVLVERHAADRHPQDGPRQIRAGGARPAQGDGA